MKKITKINLIFLGIILVLLFTPLPIPVENVEGAKDKDNYIHGGFYWTSIYEQVGFRNYIPLSIFLIPIILRFAFFRNKDRLKEKKD